ncbi:MAG: hypothetical protein PWQ80_6 [Thermotoga sp.]|nr:hypothetical protein [Thermotoga sp.]MDK2949571.1 hypothetical protein [Thermotoga sp.]
MTWFFEGLLFCGVGLATSILFSYFYLKEREKLDLSAFRIFNEFTVLGLIFLFSWVFNSMVFRFLVAVLAVLFFLGESAHFLMSIDKQYRIMFLSFEYNDREFSLYQIRKRLFRSFVKPALKFFGLYAVFSNVDLKSPLIVPAILLLGVTIGLLNGINKFD